MQEFFNFTEAPDFAALLGASYKGVNASFDRAEELERQNDAVREKNAELPFEITKELIALSPTLSSFSPSLKPEIIMSFGPTLASIGV